MVATISLFLVSLLKLCESNQPNIERGHIMVLLIFCFGGLGFIGYVKHSMADPLVGVACSMASISIITILTKEGECW